MKDLGIYIHIPFCRHKCSYCDFLSFESTEPMRENYVNHLLKEIEYNGEKYGESYAISTVFIGGGTPSLLSTEQLIKILEAIKKYFTLNNDAEITMESNPESLVHQDIKKLLEIGYNRLSIGIQSANNRLLKSIDRAHSVEMAIEAYNQARDQGCNNINLDFILSLPSETRDEFQKNIDLIDELAPEHVSAYSLILEEDTPMHLLLRRDRLKLIDDEEDRWRNHEFKKALEKLGYSQYEISNFAKPGFECQHNLRYWELGEYLGIGLGAHGHINGKRYWNTKIINEYFNSIEQRNLPLEDYEILSIEDKINEKMMLGLRLNQGIPLGEKLINGETIQDFFAKAIQKNLDSGLILIKNGCLVLTEKGRDLANQVELDFFIE